MTKRRATSPAQPDSLSNTDTHSGTWDDSSGATSTKRARLDENSTRGNVKANSPILRQTDDVLNPTPPGKNISKPDSEEPNSDSGSSSKPASGRKLSALAPVFVPTSASTSGSSSPAVSKQTQIQKSLDSYCSPATKNGAGGSNLSPPKPDYLRPAFKSEPLQIKDSTFQARLFNLDAPEHKAKILAHMKRNYSEYQHHMAGWRYLVLKPGMTGLEGEDAFTVEQGSVDDGETRGGKAVLDVIEKMGMCDVLVVVSRRFGGTMLGPARFTHIADCARAVCGAMNEREKAAERATKVADLVAQLREWDTEVTDLRSEIAALEPKKAETEVQASEGKQPTVSLKPPDYTNILNPPDVEKAERLLQARQKTVQSLKSALEKKRQKPADQEIS